MNPQELCTKLEGVIGFPVTPFKDDHSLDLDGYRKNIRYMLAQPMCALVAAGGTGELYSLTPEEVRQVVEATIEEAAGRMPVIAGVGFAGGLAKRLAAQAADCGADGVLAFPPYYPNAEMDGLVNYYSSIAEASGLGVLITAVTGRTIPRHRLSAWLKFQMSSRGRMARRTFADTK